MTPLALLRRLANWLLDTVIDPRVTALSRAIGGEE